MGRDIPLMMTETALNFNWIHARDSLIAWIIRLSKEPRVPTSRRSLNDPLSNPWGTLMIYWVLQFSCQQFPSFFLAYRDVIYLLFFN